MQSMDTQIDSGTFTRLHYFILHLFLYLGYHLLDAGRMDTAIGNQLMKCQTSHLTADRVKGRKDNGIGRIINNDFNPVAASKALMLRPSRPMIRPFSSSESILKPKLNFRWQPR